MGRIAFPRSIQSALLILFFAALFSCQKSPSGFTVQGNVSGIDSGKVYLTLDTAFSFMNVSKPFDTTEVKGGKFVFKGSVPMPMPCFVTREDGVAIAYFILENSNISVEVAAGADWLTGTIKGSQAQAECEKFDDLENSPMDAQENRIDSLLNQQGLSTLMVDSLNIEGSKLDSLMQIEYSGKLTSYLKSNPKSYGALYGFRSVVGELWDEGAPANARMQFELLDSSLRQSQCGKWISRQIQYFESMQIGHAAPEFNLKDMNGNWVRLSDFSGKRILLFSTAYWNLEAEDVLMLSDLIKKNYVILANNPGPTWSKLKCIMVYEDEKVPSGYVVESEVAPNTFVIDEKGAILSKGYYLDGLK